MVLLLGGKSNPLLGAVHTALIDRVDVLWLDHENLINDLQVDDEITRDGNVTIRWNISGSLISPSRFVGVLNELQYLPESAFQHYHMDDREYAAAEYTAYLFFALSHFPNVLNPPSYGTLSGFARSLPFQWMMISLDFPTFRVPQFHFGDHESLPEFLRNGYNSILSHDIYNTRHWKTEPAFIRQTYSSPALTYERPPGQAVFFAVVGDRLWSYGSIDEHSPDVPYLDIEPILLAISAKLSLRLATILMFYDRKTATWIYGSATPSLDVKSLPQMIVSDVMNYIIRLLGILS